MNRRAVQPLNNLAARRANEMIYLLYQDRPQPNPLFDAGGGRQPIDPEAPRHDRVRQLWLDIYQMNGGQVESAPADPTQPQDDCEHCPDSEPPPAEFLFDFHYLPGRPETRDFTLTLFTDDEGPEYRQSHHLDEAGAVEDLGDGHLRVRFTDILPERSYAMEVAPGSAAANEDNEPYLTFKGAILPRQGAFSQVREEVFEEGLAETETVPETAETDADADVRDDWLLLTGRLIYPQDDETDDEADDEAEEPGDDAECSS